MEAPWPPRQETVPWLLGAHQAGAVLWLPSAQEQDAAWNGIFGVRARLAAAGEHHLAQMRALHT